MRALIRLHTNALRLSSPVVLAMSGSRRNTSGGKSASGPVFGDGDKVLDRGVWKRYKYCSQCKLVSVVCLKSYKNCQVYILPYNMLLQIIVERKSFKGNWDSVKYCGDKCRKLAKQKGSNQTEEDSN